MMALASSDIGAAVDRLALSREHLRQALLTATGSAAARPRATSSTAHMASATADGAGSPLAAAWLDRLAESPAARVVVEALRVWWCRHPLRLGLRLAAGAVDAVVQPVARKHPLGLVLGAALAGALLAWTRPWRWAPRAALAPALLAGLLPQLLSQALAQVPPGAWAAMLSSLLPGQDKAPAAPAVAPGQRPRQSQ